MGNKPLLSIIIPAYNAETFIRRCLDSIKVQDYNYEVIIVNDGSVDGTAQICEKYAVEDSRFRVIHQKNAGVSSARNAALSVIRGEYFTFVDADDWLSKNFCEVIFPKIELSSYDVIMYARFFNTDVNEWGLNFLFDAERVLTSDDMEYIIALTAGFNDEHLKQDVDLFGWNGCKIYRTSMLGDTRFDSNLKFGEDTLFAMEMLIKLKNMICISDRLYHYYIHEASATHKENMRITGQVIEMMDKLTNAIPDNLRESKLIQQSILQRNIYKLMFCIDLSVVKGITNRTLRENAQRIKEIAAHEIFSNSINAISLQPFRIANKIKILLLRNKMFRLYAFLLRYK